MASSPAAKLLAHQNRFRAFLISRLGNESDADDLLQNGLVKALQAAESVRDEEKLIAWFYQILRRAIIDHVRSRRAARAREDAWTKDGVPGPVDETARNLCGCFEALLPELKPREADLIRRIELEGAAVSDAARELSLTPNNASVTLHRARKALREKLEKFCGSCASGACLDCDCAD